MDTTLGESQGITWNTGPNPPIGRWSALRRNGKPKFKCPMTGVVKLESPANAEGLIITADVSDFKGHLLYVSDSPNFVEKG